MPQWDSKQFDSKANEVAHSFHASRGTLRELTTKLSRENGLNEEQIRRLGRAVNVKAFEQKFASLKGKADRIVEFDPVDPEHIIQDLFHDSPAAEKTAEAIYPDLPDQMHPREMVKTASVSVYEELRQSIPKDPPIESQINHWSKVAEELRVKIAGAELRWDSAIATIHDRSRRLHWNRDEFEKDALAIYGPDVITELNALRTEAKLPTLEINESTATKLASYLFGEENEETLLIKSASDARSSYIKGMKALQLAKEKVAELTKRLLG